MELDLTHPFGTARTNDGEADLFPVDGKGKAFALADALAGTHERKPDLLALFGAIEQEHLDTSTGRAPREQAYRHDARLVEHEEIASAQESWNFRKPVIFEVVLPNEHQPRRVTPRRGALRDQRGGKFVVVGGGEALVHAAILVPGK